MSHTYEPNPNSRKHAISELFERLHELNDLLPRACRRVATDLQNQPDWFRQMVNQSAIDEIEARFQIRVPQAIRLFYKYPAYALFMRAHFDIDVFIEPCFSVVSERPVITKSTYPPWLAIGDSPHTGMLFMVQLDTDTPRVAWRYFESSPDDYIFPNTFQDWLLNGADRVLEKNADTCVECAKSVRPKDE